MKDNVAELVKLYEELLPMIITKTKVGTTKK